MAIDALTGAVYNDAANYPGRTRTETNAVPNPGMNINITEVPVVRAPGSGQTGKDQTNGQKDNSASSQQIKDAITKANNKLKAHRTRCEFSFNEETKRVSIKVLDEDTEEVIKEIPPEQTLEMVEKMWELAGLLVDEKR